MKTSTMRILVGMAVVGVFILFKFLGVDSYFSLQMLHMHSSYLSDYIASHYFLSVLCYIVSCIVTVTFCLPITPFLTLASGYFFGFFYGTIYSSLGGLIGASFSFLLFRYLLGSFVQERYGSTLATFNQEFEKQGMYYLLFLQLLPITPFGVVCMIASLSIVPLSTFIGTVFVGALPSYAVYAFAGRQMMDVHNIKDVFSPPVLLALGSLAVVALMPIVIQKYKGSKQKG